MKHAIQYINETLGTNTDCVPVQKDNLGNLPIFINETYRLFKTVLMNNELLLAEPKNGGELSIMQIEKHIQLLKTTFNKKVVLVIENLAAYNRKRLIEKGINFVVAGKQLFLPELLIDLRENYPNRNVKEKNDKLLPSAQFILIYHIIHRYAKNNQEQGLDLENLSFKEIAQNLDYTAMAVTNAIDNLKYHELIDVMGEREKYIHFRYDRSELWRIAEDRKLLINPVLKRVFVDEKPKKPFLLRANASAMPEYTNLNPSRQEYFAIEKNAFYELQKSNVLKHPNEYEGNYCLEVWKYNPLTLVDELANDMPVVDPLSLYLSLKDSKDERVEMALEELIEKHIW